MGKRLKNWLSKASSSSTKNAWKHRWKKFIKWVTTATDPLTDEVFMACASSEVDDVIRKDFEDMPSHLFGDKYRNILTHYLVSLRDLKANTARSMVSSIRAFFTSECVSIRLAQGKIPQPQMAFNEHRFIIEEFRKMWLVADCEGKARLSVAVSLGWGASDFLSLKKDFVKGVISLVDSDGFASFDYQRKKTKARIRGILNPTAVADLVRFLRQIPEGRDNLWSFKTPGGVNEWFKKLFREGGLENGPQKLRFHAVRKYVFDLVSSTVGVFEAKLLTGKKISISDETYLINIQDRLLARYKVHAYPLLRLDGNEQRQDGIISEEIKEKIEDLKTTVNVLSQARVLQEIKIQRLEEENRIDSKRIDEMVELWNSLSGTIQKIEKTLAG